MPQARRRVVSSSNMERIFDVLMSRAKPYQEAPHGVSLEDFARIPASPSIGEEILDGLSRSDPRDRSVSLFFCEGFSRHAKLTMLGERFISALPSRVEALISDPDDSVRSAAYPLFVQMAQRSPNYRSAMLKALTDRDSVVRTVALNASATFLKKREIEPLLPFEHDPYLSEVGGMGGPVHYVIRNHALATIERMLDRQFVKHELTEMVEGEAVFWWDWKPMLDWYEKSKHGLWAKLRDKLHG